MFFFFVNVLFSCPLLCLPLFGYVFVLLYWFFGFSVLFLLLRASGFLDSLSFASVHLLFTLVEQFHEGRKTANQLGNDQHQRPPAGQQHLNQAPEQKKMEDPYTINNWLALPVGNEGPSTFPPILRVHPFRGIQHHRPPSEASKDFLLHIVQNSNQLIEKRNTWFVLRTFFAVFLVKLDQNVRLRLVFFSPAIPKLCISNHQKNVHQKLTPPKKKIREA